MKRILIFVPEFPRLSETFIEREIYKLIERGNLDISIFSLIKAGGYMRPSVELRTHYERPSVLVCVYALFFALLHPIRFFKAVNLILLSSDETPLFPTLTKGFEGYTNSRLIHFFKGLAYTVLFKKFKPDHIHAHWMSDSSTIAMTASIMLEVPLSISGHAIDILVEGTLIRNKVRYSKFISICNSFAYRKCLEAVKPNNPTNVHLMLHGVEIDQSLKAAGKYPKKNRPLILSVNRFVEKKGLTYLIEASKHLNIMGVTHEINIIGYGELYEDLLKQIKILGLEDTVKILGDGKGLPNDEVMEILKIADLYVHPGIQLGSGDSDGIPNTVIEACLAGVCVVSTDVGSVCDLINESTGVLVTQRDSTSLAKAIKDLLEDSQRRTKLAQAGRQKATEMFNLDKNVEKLEKLLLA